MGNNYVLYKYKYVFIIFFLILGFLIHFGPFLSFDYYFGPSQDNINWLQPFFSMQSRIFQNGELPLWNPNGFEEFYSDPFHSIFYPFYFIFFDLYETPLSSMKMIYSIALFHLLLTIFAMYYLLKQLNLSNFSSSFWWNNNFLLYLLIYAINLVNNDYIYSLDDIIIGFDKKNFF